MILHCVSYDCTTQSHTSSISQNIFDPLYPLCTLLPLFSSGNHLLLSVSIRFCLRVLFVHLLLWVFYSTYDWTHIVLDFLCLTYFVKHDILKIHLCCKWRYFIFPYFWVVLHCIYVPQLPYCLTFQGTLQLFLSLGHCE